MKKLGFGFFFTLSFLFIKAQEPYSLTIPNTSEKIEFVPIPAGDFFIGSPATEANRKFNEGPQIKLSISPFFMSKFEITWDTYLLFQNLEISKTQNTVDAISGPTKPYVEMSFGQGKNGGFPVCNITQYAARAYCKWLYQLTRDFYRLPTEAEWEYAARAGSKEAYHFGQDPKTLAEYAWFYENSNGAYKKVGLKKPNAWGLYDMYGNVAEWTSDAFTEMSLKRYETASKDPYFPSETLYAHTIKGGHWDSDADACRSASREGSTPALKRRDPQIPRSKWWLTNAPFLGFRIVKPAVKPSLEFINNYYSLPPEDN